MYVVIVSLARSQVFKVWRGQNILLRGKLFVFIMCLKQIFIFKWCPWVKMICDVWNTSSTLMSSWNFGSELSQQSTAHNKHQLLITSINCS